MKIHKIESGNFKLDGGAMFGVVPKSLWTRTNPADANNMCDWSMRCMLVEDGDRLMLIDTGIGDKQDEKFFSYYYLWGAHSLKGSIEAAGFSMDDITDVFLTHLHFDHVGGAVQWNKDRTGFEPVFKNAVYWSNEKHWDWAVNPNPREKASFLTENIRPLQESGQLKFIERNGDYMKNVFPHMDVFFADGHTESQMIPILNYQGRKVAFMADLLPSAGHLPLPYVMGYDTRPLLTLTEKEKFLKMAVEEDMVLFLEHDHVNECIVLKDTEKGPRLKESHQFNELFLR